MSKTELRRKSRINMTNKLMTLLRIDPFRRNKNIWRETWKVTISNRRKNNTKLKSKKLKVVKSQISTLETQT